MNGERRQDIGLKLVYVSLTAIITLLLSLFFNKTYAISEQALRMANENSTSIAVVQEWIKSTNITMEKMDLKLDTLVGWKNK